MGKDENPVHTKPVEVPEGAYTEVVMETQKRNPMTPFALELVSRRVL